MSCLYKDRLTH